MLVKGTIHAYVSLLVQVPLACVTGGHILQSILSSCKELKV